MKQNATSLPCKIGIKQRSGLHNSNVNRDLMILLSQHMVACTFQSPSNWQDQPVASSYGARLEVQILTVPVAWNCKAAELPMEPSLQNLSGVVWIWRIRLVRLELKKSALRKTRSFTGRDERHDPIYFRIRV
ncbi:hypothetical protein NPIL_129381 [Nephila pilipes]|uniref:Uncharacterized protein n=1 Tax=Nephila pilipes TaxID=299642 RepID=A0A8X6P0P9_NEPPI|nr:hypothetical protein NPIL_129381 [Nephila pilipes]